MLFARAGCSLGGTLAMTAPDLYEFFFADCGLTDGLLPNGTGSYDFENDLFQIDAAIGQFDCVYSYTRSGDQIEVEDNCALDPFAS